jgi:chromate transporter
MCADIHDGREQDAPSKGRIQMCETKNLQISQIQLAPHGRSIQLCQFLPGPNVVNLSVVFGRRIRGVPGAAVALLGLLGPPFVIVTLIAAAYAKWGEIAALQRMLLGVAAAAVGLILGTCAKMALPLFKDRLGLAPLVALATFVSIGVLRWPLYGALAVLVPLSIAIAWVRR